MKQIIIDNGSHSIKAGFGGQDTLKIFKTVIGEEGKDEDKIYPIEDGIIKNFNAIEQIWNKVFYKELNVEPNEYSVLLTEPPLNPRSIREKTTQIMFETFQVQELYISIQPVLSLYESGINTGIVLNCGHGKSNIVPIYDGLSMQFTMLNLDFAGDDLTKYMSTLLLNQHKLENYSSSELYNISNEIKEKLSYVSLDYYDELNQQKQKDSISYTLPDGKTININNEILFKCPELLFNPIIGGKSSQSIHEIIYSSIMKCDVDIRKELYGNILLTGGSTLFSGFANRIEKEFYSLAPLGMKTKIKVPKNPLLSVWYGGSMFAQSLLKQQWISNAEYDEFGPSLIHKKCF